MRNETVLSSWENKRSGWLCLLVLLASILNALSLIHISYPLAWLAFPFLFYALLNSTGKKAAVFIGASFGFSSSLLLNFWMIPVIKNYAQGSVVTGIATWLGISLLLAIFFGFQFYLFSLLRSPDKRRFSALHNALLMASLWVCFEWLRGEWFSGIPWLNFSTGITEGSNLFLIQQAALGGIHLLSFLIILSAYLIAYAVHKKNWKFLLIPACILGLQFPVGFFLYKNVQQELTAGKENRFSAALIMAALKPETVWNDQSAGSLVEHLLSLNAKAVEMNPDLIVWSETIVPWTYAADDDFIKEIFHQTKKTKAHTLMGMNSSFKNSSEILCNSAYFSDSSGKVMGRYDKEQLLTFVEKPLFNESGNLILPFLSQSGLKMRSSHFNKAIQTNWGKAGVLICNESTNSHLSTKLAKSGASYLVNMGNDSWFSDYFITRQHFYNNRLRAVETRKDVVINNNMGISGIIRASGEIPNQYNSAISRVKVVEVRPNSLPSGTPQRFMYAVFFTLSILILISIYKQLIKPNQPTQ